MRVKSIPKGHNQVQMFQTTYNWTDKKKSTPFAIEL